MSYIISKLGTRLTIHVPPRLDIRKENRWRQVRTCPRIEGTHLIDNMTEVIRLNCVREVG